MTTWRDNIYIRWYLQFPPVSRLLTLLVVSTSLPPLLYLIRPTQLVNFWDYTIRGELWRPFTAFLYGGSGMNLLFGLFFLWQYSQSLETTKFTTTAGYVWYLAIIAVQIMGLHYALGSIWYFSAFTMSLCATTALENPSQRTNLFGLVSLELKFLPYALLALTFVQAGPGEAVNQGAGIVASWAYRKADELGYIHTPAIIERIVGRGTWLDSVATTVQDGGTRRGYGTVYKPREEQAETTRPRFSGSGHVLGGD